MFAPIHALNMSDTGLHVYAYKCINNTLCLQCRYRHRHLSVIVPVSPYKILYSYVALVPAPSCIWQYKFIHKFAGTLDMR